MTTKDIFTSEEIKEMEHQLSLAGVSFTHPDDINERKQFMDVLNNIDQTLGA